MSISFVVSRNEMLLQQYYALREECFRAELGVADFDGGEDHYDRSGTVLLAVEDGDRVIAGMRIFGSYADNPVQLPLENEAFRIRDSFPELGLANRSYCYWGRLVCHPSHRNDKGFAKLFLGKLLELSAELGFSYAFIVTDSIRSRFYRQVHSTLGYEYRILEEVTPAEQKFADLEHLIACSVLQPANRPQPTPGYRHAPMLAGYPDRLNSSPALLPA